MTLAGETDEGLAHRLEGLGLATQVFGVRERERLDNGADRLLRSLVVLPTRRGKGYGRMLVERLEGVDDGAVKRLHLLTSGTGEFFRRLGYADADRDVAPAVIAATAQFTSLCGPRATYLIKDLG